MVPVIFAGTEDGAVPFLIVVGVCPTVHYLMWPVMLIMAGLKKSLKMTASTWKHKSINFLNNPVKESGMGRILV